MQGLWAAGIWSKRQGGGSNEPSRQPLARDILDFWKGSKIEVTQCYLIELKALSDIIV